MLQVYRNFLLVALPWLVLAVLEAWVFPLDKFTFRAWEAVQANLLTQDHRLPIERKAEA